MVFSSLTFLLCFLPALLLLYFSVPQKYTFGRKCILFIFSLIFYGSGEPSYIFVILSCIFITWLITDKIEKGYMPAFVLAVLINLLPLVFFKYTGFITENINGVVGRGFLRAPNFALPIGISFYTFQILSYIVDLWREDIEREDNFVYFTLYIMFFPQLIAGPANGVL